MNLHYFETLAEAFEALRKEHNPAAESLVEYASLCDYAMPDVLCAVKNPRYKHFRSLVNQAINRDEQMQRDYLESLPTVVAAPERLQ